MTVTVAIHEDIYRAHEDIGGRDVQAVVAALDSDHEVVAWVPDWLLDDKAIEPQTRKANVVVGALEHETDRAWLVSDSNGQDAWLPKSVAVRFERADGGEEIATPQTRLDEVTD